MAPIQKPGRSKQDYATPHNFLTAVKRLLSIDRFTFDFAADYQNAVAPAFYDVTVDALSKSDWSYRCGSGWGWLNPPYANIGPWAKKCQQCKKEGGQIAFLVPAGVGANWFRDYVDGVAKVLLLNGRLAFMKDKPTWLYPKDCILCLFSPSIKPEYAVWSWKALV
jgi:phage N-6-adenine-methyltransferase